MKENVKVELAVELTVGNTSHLQKEKMTSLVVPSRFTT